VWCSLIASRSSQWRVFLLCSSLLAVPAIAQQQEDPENEKRLGLWLDQTISAGLSSKNSLELEFHERFNEGASNLYEYFFQGGIAFRPRPWLTLIPIYRYQRLPGGYHHVLRKPSAAQPHNEHHSRPVEA